MNSSPSAAKKRAARWTKLLASSVVFDSSAILAVLFQEPGAEKVADLLNGGLLSTVTLAEVSAVLALRGTPPDLVRSRIREMGCEVCLFEEEIAHRTGELAAQTRPYGLSLGDRACLALASAHKAIACTTDSNWKKLHLGIEVIVIR
jgi:ribonuclease VapC